MSVENDLIEGAIDIHVHAEPDAQRRKTDCIEHCFAATTEFLRPKRITTVQEIAKQIREVRTD
jgi:hypothetical protein